MLIDRVEYNQARRYRELYEAGRLEGAEATRLQVEVLEGLLEAGRGLSKEDRAEVENDIEVLRSMIEVRGGSYHNEEEGVKK